MFSSFDVVDNLIKVNVKLLLGTKRLLPASRRPVRASTHTEVKCVSSNGPVLGQLRCFNIEFEEFSALYESNFRNPGNARYHKASQLDVSVSALRRQVFPFYH